MTKKEKRLYKRWKKYLSDSRLSDQQVQERAVQLTKEKKKP